MTEKEQRRRRFWVVVARWFARAQAWALSRVDESPVWVDTQGDAWAYHELKDPHLANILRLMTRDGQKETKKPVFKALLDEAESRDLRWQKNQKKRRW